LKAFARQKARLIHEASTAIGVRSAIACEGDHRELALLTPGFS
jgi:hypothetical protein